MTSVIALRSLLFRLCYAHADGAGRDDDVHRYIRKRRKLERETENARYEQMNHIDYEFTIRPGPTDIGYQEVRGVAVSLAGQRVPPYTVNELP